MKLTQPQIKQLVNTVAKAGILKEIRRTGWVLKGVEEAESVADHTWRMSLLILLLADKTLDKGRLFAMCAVHDLGEIGVGDIKWETGKKVIASQAIKHEDELKTMRQLFGNSNGSSGHIKLLKEFNEQKTPEAKFLKQIDKLEMAFQALEYEQKGYPGHLFNEFWENAEKYLAGNSLEPIFRELQKLRGK